MPAPIRFYFDFASPYAWFAVPGLTRLAAEAGRAVEWRPVLLWALLKAQGLPPPMETAAKRAYMLKDMERSAAFLGVPFVPPEEMAISTHLAARLFYTLAEEAPERAEAFARAVFSAHLAERRRITDPAVLAQIASAHGLAPDAAAAAMGAPEAKASLAQAVDEAAADGACGSPFFVLDGEGFFGADRLPQMAWRLTAARRR